MRYRYVIRHLAFLPEVQTSCHLSTSAAAYKRKPFNPYFNYKTKEAFTANIPIKKTQKEFFLAQKKRRPSDYPLGEDLKGEWKHTRWYDRMLNKWVDSLPMRNRREFNTNEKEKRTLIHEQNTLRNIFHLLLDSETRRKYIIKPFYQGFARNASYYYQHLTNTKYVHGMPHNIHAMHLPTKALEKFETFLTNMLQMEYHYNNKTASEQARKQRSDRILTNIVNQLIDVGSSLNTDFLECEVDHNPENSHYWQRGRGFHKWTLPDDLPVLFQSHDYPIRQIRIKNRLPEFTPFMENFMLSGTIPYTDMTPHVYDFERRYYRNTITPGIRYKAGDVEQNYQEAMEEKKLAQLPPPLMNSCSYGHTQFFSLPEEFDNDWYKPNIHHCDITDQKEEHIKAHGIMSGYTWSAAQAHYLGHWFDNDITEPIAVQSVITDGQHVSFFCYQLNTIAIDPENAPSNPRRNICYGTPIMKLFNRVESSDDIELYEDTVKLLLKFILNGSHLKINKEEAISHNSNLEVQQWDDEKPSIELQKPKHVREKEMAALEEAEKRELERSKTLKEKVWNVINR